MEIKLLTSPDELNQIVDLQKKVWGFSDIDCVPLNMLVAISSSGGFAIGCFIENKLVGFSLTFIGLYNDRPYHHIHMLGVDILNRGGTKQIAKKIMKFHYDITSSSQVKIAMCTYDPLESVNAYIYLHLAKGIIDKPLKVNEYGNLDNNIPSDRFCVSWYYDSKRLNKIFKPEVSSLSDNNNKSHQDIVIINEIDPSTIKPTFNKLINSKKIGIEIPRNFKDIKKTDSSLALEWRIKTREVFNHYLYQGYKIVDFIQIVNNKQKRVFYIIEKE